MSPEQAEMSALGVDTRSDIYSLGVLLYELLTGSTPLSSKRMKEAAYAEILRLIKEEEPPKPSTRLSDSGETLASISAQRHTEPAKLSKLMRGELDWIVMKTLEKDRPRRYETASAFAADIQHYLSDEAVQACPPTMGYRLRKFVRRNKLPVLAAAIMLTLLAAGIVGTTFGLVRERQPVKLVFMSDVTRILSAIEHGDPHASAQLLPIVYEELRTLAAQRLAQEAPGQTLQATALVHEAYLRLVGGAAEQNWDSRSHFFAAAAESMRRILVEIARRKQRVKHGGQLERLEIEIADVPTRMPPEELIALHEALLNLEQQDPVKARLVTVRYFGGVTIEQAAEALGISRVTAHRYWTYARAFLHQQITGTNEA